MSNFSDPIIEKLVPFLKDRWRYLLNFSILTRQSIEFSSCRWEKFLGDSISRTTLNIDIEQVSPSSF